jgi:lipoyl(octanoyl) transferase
VRKVIYRDLGRIDYKAAWELQEQLHEEIVAGKLSRRQAVATGTSADDPAGPPGYLLFCEHPHVYTLGRSGDDKHLLADEAALRTLDATFYKNNRGGDITYHGPGQIVGYPILDLEQYFTDIHRYLRTLEEAVIATLAAYDIAAGRIDGLTGVWLDPADPVRARKICAYGVRCSRWVTMHGFAFNVNTDLSYFGHIVPCGIADKAVTSMQQELGRPVDMDGVKQHLRHHLAHLFGMDLTAG